MASLDYQGLAPQRDGKLIVFHSKFQRDPTIHTRDGIMSYVFHYIELDYTKILLLT